ncbi:MAG TPA: trimethylamine methyltransferase family protein, partial [Candidatus Polarisedimenticolia bacterium]|nr:trimethylamine methyltransferase family protein [Candidatus Polarisedimenticolia bacterium]
MTTQPHDPLPEADARRLVEAALQILRDTGVKFDPDRRVMDLFSAAGCEVSADGMVRFDSRLVLDSIETVAKRVRIWDRAGNGFLDVGGGRTYFFAGMTAIQVLDPTTGERRRSTRDDLAAITRVADALPDIDGVCVTCKIVEHSNIQGDMEEFAVLAANTTKPLEFLSESDEAFAAAIEMAAAIRGGADRLAEKPYFIHQVTPLPLYFAKEHIDQIVRGVESGIPLLVGTVTMGGATAPISMAGNLAVGLATDFAAMVLSQLVRRGSYCVGCSDIGYIDPATGGIGGLAQRYLSDMVMCQIRRLLGLPTTCGAGAARHRAFNQVSVAQASLSMMQAFYKQPATCDYLGLLDNSLSYSPHLLLFDHDLIGLLRHLWNGVRVDDETLALDVIRAVGPRGNFLVQRHTAKHCRSELWTSRYLMPQRGASRADVPEPDLIDRIDQD